jgi:hypothetical protein
VFSNSPQQSGGTAAARKTLSIELMVVCKDTQEGFTLFEWSPDTLENRVFLMRELFDHWCCNEFFDMNSLPRSRDPFWDPVMTEYVVGSCRIYLEPLAFQCEAVADAKLLSSDGKPLDTTLRVELLPWEENQVSKCGILNDMPVKTCKKSRNETVPYILFHQN